MSSAIIVKNKKSKPYKFKKLKNDFEGLSFEEQVILADKLYGDKK